MATENANGYYYFGDIAVGSESYGTRYGIKVLKKVYLDATGDYRYIVQHGEVKDNKFTLYNNGKDLSLYSKSDLEYSYKYLWTKDPEPTFEKGDILEGKDRDGKRVVFLFESADLVHRLTAYRESGPDVSWASLKSYQSQVTDLKVVKNSYNQKPFSKI